MQEVLVPKSFGPRAVPRWFRDWGEHAEAAELSIRVPAQTFVSPAGIVVLAAGIAARKAGGLRTSIRFDGEPSDLKQYLQRIDFFSQLGVDLREDFVRHEPEGRFVPLKRITDMRIARDLADKTADCLEHQLPNLSPSPVRMARFVFEELGANVVQHSQRPETGFGLAQAFSKSRKLEIAFADRGVGFLASLQRNPELGARIEDDAVALQFALSQGVSGVSNPRSNMGLGLKLLQDFSDHLRADLWIASGSALLWRRTTVGTQRANTLQTIARWPGSWICLEATLPEAPLPA